LGIILEPRVKTGDTDHERRFRCKIQIKKVINENFCSRVLRGWVFERRRFRSIEGPKNEEMPVSPSSTRGDGELISDEIDVVNTRAC